MSRFDEYKNELDDDDDGEELEITDEDEAASDDEGRELAATCIAAGRSVRGRHRLDEHHRRMWFRLAKKALAEGAERRNEAEAAENARVAAEKARIAAEEKAERKRVAQQAKQQSHRERFERSMSESDDRWARLDEQTRRENAAWESGRGEREEMAARAAQAAAGRTNAGREAARSPTTITMTNAAISRPTTKPLTTKMLPKPANPTRVPMPGPERPGGSALQAAQEGSRSGETRLSGGASEQPSLAWTEPKPPRVEPDRRVAPSPPEQPQQRRSAPTATPQAKRPVPSQLATPITQAPAPVAANAPSRSFAPSVRVLTGADLAAWRSARGLTQRPAADLLGVAPSTVAKAELLPGKALGDQLQVALAVNTQQTPR